MAGNGSGNSTSTTGPMTCTILPLFMLLISICFWFVDNRHTSFAVPETEYLTQPPFFFHPINNPVLSQNQLAAIALPSLRNHPTAQWHQVKRFSLRDEPVAGSLRGSR